MLTRDQGPLSPLRRWSSLAGVFVVYVLAGKLGLQFAFVHASATALWPPTGIALAALVLGGYRLWPAVFLGAVVVNVTTAGSLASSLGIAIGNTAEAVIGASLVERFAAGRRAFALPRTIFTFILGAGLVAPLASASLGVSSLALAGYARWADAGTIWLTWWLGDAAGALVVAPLIIIWAGHPRVHDIRRRLPEALSVLLVVVAVGAVVFGGAVPPLAFLSLPPLVWAAYRFGAHGATTALAALAAVAEVGTLQGQGPFAVGSPNASLLLLQAFLVTISATVLPLAALAEELARRGARSAENARLAEQARREEQELSDFFENAAVPLHWVGPDGVILRANRAELALLGYPREQYVGRPIADFHVDPETITDILRRLAAGETLHAHPARLRASDGSILHVVVDANVHRENGRFVHARCFTRDVTALRRAEEETARLLADAGAARAEAEAASRAKDEFLAVLSHELRTPLNAIVGWARMLRTGTVPASAVSNAMEVIDRNAAAQGRLIEDLLDVSRIVSGTLRAELRPVKLAPVIAAAIDAVRPSADRKGVRVESRVAPAVDFVMADPGRLQQVVWNLLSNAVKFTPPNGRVTVAVGESDDSIVISVADTGSGIDAAALPHIFERFRQADSSTTRQHGGLGLGLALVKHIVELHGGTVTAASDGPGKGATFTITLQRAAPAETGPRAVSRSEPRVQLSGASVLVVDDETDARDLCAEIFARHGATVITAESVSQALERLKAVKPDVVVADIGMPDEDGFALIRRLRADESDRGRRTIVVALTAYVTDDHRRRVLEAGFDAHVPKPFDPKRLSAIVNDLLRPSRAPSV